MEEFDKTEDGSGRTLSPEEERDFLEFKRVRRETEVMLTLRKIIADASRRETDRAAVHRACEFAKRTKGSGVLVSPVHAAQAKKELEGTGIRVICLVGGSGETLPAVKKAEAKKVLRLGAEEIRLVPCYSALACGNLGYLKREVKKVKRAAGKKSVILSLEDHALTPKEVTAGVRAACEGGANGVCVRGENDLVVSALENGAGKLFVDCSGVENAGQLTLLLRAGASRLTSSCGEKLMEELYAAAKDA